MSNDKQIQKRLELPHRETLVGINTIQTNPFDNQKTTTMSNNKQIMKLYTEDQVKQMIEKSRETGLTAEYLILANKGIELPSDEEIQKESLKSDFEYTFRNGAKWMRDKIQGGNNEQQ